jgi:hypothetical protein
MTFTRPVKESFGAKLLHRFRGVLPHSDVPPFIALPFPEGANTVPLEGRLNVYEVSGSARSSVVDLTARRMLENGWPANQ